MWNAHPLRINYLRHIDGILRALQEVVAHFDRKIHGVDVIENVFRGVQLLPDDSPTTDMVDLDVRRWWAGTAISVVRISVLTRKAEATPSHGSRPKSSR